MVKLCFRIFHRKGREVRQEKKRSLCGLGVLRGSFSKFEKAIKNEERKKVTSRQ